jgi:hypothetical protein
MVLASELIKKLAELVKERGDLPVMVAINCDGEHTGTYDIEPPKFDSDGAGDDCYIV